MTAWRREVVGSPTSATSRPGSRPIVVSPGCSVNSWPAYGPPIATSRAAPAEAPAGAFPVPGSAFQPEASDNTGPGAWNVSAGAGSPATVQAHPPVAGSRGVPQKGQMLVPREGEAL